MVSFAERFLELRKEKHICQAEAADIIGISLRTYCRYESGEREPGVSVLIRMADFYGVSIDYLVGRNDVR